MRAEIPTDYEVDEKCPICDRKVFVRNPDDALELIIRDGCYYQAWRVHGSCIERTWALSKGNESSIRFAKDLMKRIRKSAMNEPEARQ